MANSGINHVVTSVPVPRSQYESEEHHALVSGTSFPASPVEKQLFYRTDEHKLYIYNGTSWVDCTSQGVTVHNNLTGRDAADCHPLAAITDLADHSARHELAGADVISLAGLSGEPAELTTHKDLTTNVHGVGALGFKVTSKVKLETRDMTAASGDVSYTGYGFQPTALVIFAGRSSGSVMEMSWGASDSAKAMGEVNLRYPAVDGSTSYCILVQSAAGSEYQFATLKSYDADGFTLTWTKGGSPSAGTLKFVVLALK
jgi:hypothetical protein